MNGLQTVTGLTHSSTLTSSHISEYGVLMLANVLRRDTATQMSTTLVKTFVKLRKLFSSNTHLQLEIEQIKNYIQHQSKKQENQDKSIDLLFQYIDQLQKELPPPSTHHERKKIGYEVGKKDGAEKKEKNR